MEAQELELVIVETARKHVIRLSDADAAILARAIAGHDFSKPRGPRKRIYDSYHGEWMDAGPADAP